MANIVQLKRSSVSGRIPDAANVEVGEPVVNLADQIIFTKDGSGTVKVIGAGTTTNISEGTNLYFSNARVSSAISSTTLANATFSGTVVAQYFTGDGSGLTGVSTTGGFIVSTTTTFPTGDYGDFSAAADAFGVSLGVTYDCMEPNGSIVQEDLSVLT